MRNALKAARKPLGRQTHIPTVSTPIKVSETKLKSLIREINWKTALSAAAGILLIALGVVGWMYNNRQQERLKQEAADRQLFSQSREAGLANWDRIINLAILITETGTNIASFAENADKLAASINRVDDPTAKVMDETDKGKEWLNESEDIWATAAVSVRQLETASNRQTAERLSGQIENAFNKLIGIYGLMQESGELAKEVLAQAGDLNKKAMEEINRDKVAKARVEALQRKSEAEKIQAKKKEEELKKIRPTIVQQELDAIEKLRGAKSGKPIIISFFLPTKSE
jgi:hypothetical protein